MSDANRVSLYAVKEVTFGLTPNNFTSEAIRFTSEDLAFEPTTVTSDELRADRQEADLILVNQSAAGGFNFEFSYGSFDELLASTLQDHQGTSDGFVAAVTLTASTIAATASPDEFTDSGSGMAVFAIGQWVKITGVGSGANLDQYFQITTVAAGAIGVTPTPAVVSAGTSVTITQGAHITNATTIDWWSLIRRYEDLGTTPNIPVAVFKGMSPSTFELTVSPTGPITGRFGFMGKNETSATDGTVVAGTEAYNASPGAGNDVYNATSNLTSVNVAGVSYPVRNLTIRLDNNMRRREVAGTLGADSLGSGTVSVEMDLEAYYADAVEYAKLTSQARVDVWFVIRDGSTQEYLFHIPSAKYTSFDRAAPGKNQDLMARSNLKAILDTDTYDTQTIRIVKF